jgi:hypothetical protein
VVVEVSVSDVTGEVIAQLSDYLLYHVAVTVIVTVTTHTTSKREGNRNVREDREIEGWTMRQGGYVSSHPQSQPVTTTCYHYLYHLTHHLYLLPTTTTTTLPTTTTHSHHLIHHLTHHQQLLTHCYLHSVSL